MEENNNWEYDKENIQPIKIGHDVNILNEIFDKNIDNNQKLIQQKQYNL